jgi:hypothetical protein
MATPTMITGGMSVALLLFSADCHNGDKTAPNAYPLPAEEMYIVYVER